MYKIVSSSTPSYYPGIKALWNSIQINSKKCSLTVFCYDHTEEYKDLEALGIEVILNAPMLGPIIDQGKIRANGGPVNEDMFARLLIPEYFNSGRVFYVDADCIILQSIYELWDTLDLEDNYTACVWRPDIGWVGGHKHDDMASGTYLADVAKWKEHRVMEKCFETMANAKNIGRIFSVNVESVLSYVHEGHFLKLDRTYQNLTYYGLLSQEDKVAHFASIKPWNGKVNYRQLWKAYHDYNLVKISEISVNLPLRKTTENIRPIDRRRLRANQNKWS